MQGPLSALLVTLLSAFLLSALSFLSSLAAVLSEGKTVVLGPATEAHFVSSEALYSRGGVEWVPVILCPHCWVQLSRPWSDAGRLGVCSTCFLYFMVMPPLARALCIYFFLQPHLSPFMPYTVLNTFEDLNLKPS